MQSRKAVIHSWEELLKFIEERPNGTSALERLRSWSVKPEGKPIALSSLVSPLVAPYFSAYNLATADFVNGYIYRGDLQAQPAVLIEAFALIKSEFSKCERALYIARKREIERQQAEMKNRG